MPTGDNIYVPPSRRGTKLLGAHLPREIAEDFKAMALLQGTSAADILRKFIEGKLSADRSQKSGSSSVSENPFTVGVNPP